MAKKKESFGPSVPAMAAAGENHAAGAIGAGTERPLPKLRELGVEYNILLDWLAETEGEETPELADLFAQLSGETNQKVENWGLFLIGRERQAAIMKAEEDFFAAEAQRLKERRVSFEKGTARSEAQLQFQMELQGIDEVVGQYCTVALQKNPPKLLGDVLPEMLTQWFEGDDPVYTGFVRYTPESFDLNRDAVKAAAKNMLIDRLPEGLEIKAAKRLVVK